LLTDLNIEVVNVFGAVHAVYHGILNSELMFYALF